MEWRRVRLVMLQPDLGTGLAISFGAVVIMFLAGLPLWLFLSGGAAVAIAAPLAFFTLLHDYQRKRVLVFLERPADNNLRPAKRMPS